MVAWRSATGDSAPRAPARARRTLMNAVAVLVLYGNAAVALQPPALRRFGLALPRTAWLHDAFLLTGMFGSYSLANHDLFIAGERTQSGLESDRGRWIRLRVREHFVERHGVTFTQLYAAHHWDVHGRAAQRRAWILLARKIREHHNRLHPERAVARVRFGSVEWPQSPLGYRAAKGGANARARVWYAEPARP